METMTYQDRNIREHYLEDYETWKDIRYREDEEKEKSETKTSSELEDTLHKAKILIRGTIFHELNPHLKKMTYAPAPGREQIYRWLPEGLEKTKALLKRRKVKSPDLEPDTINTSDLTKEITAVWLMSYYHGKKLDENFNEYEFTISPIAQKLARLKY